MSTPSLPPISNKWKSPLSTIPETKPLFSSPIQTPPSTSSPTDSLESLKGRYIIECFTKKIKTLPPLQAHHLLTLLCTNGCLNYSKQYFLHVEAVQQAILSACHLALRGHSQDRIHSIALHISIFLSSEEIKEATRCSEFLLIFSRMYHAAFPQNRFQFNQTTSLQTIYSMTLNWLSEDSSFHNLETLNLSHLPLTAIPPELLPYLTQLKELSCNHVTPFQSSLFDSILQLSSLEKLELKQNNLTYIPRNLFAYLPQLKHLNLLQNDLPPHKKERLQTLCTQLHIVLSL